MFRYSVATALFYSGQMARQYQKALASGLPPYRIISYQHIVEPEELPYPIMPDSWINPQAFEKQMIYLRQHANLISLAELLSRFKDKKTIFPNTVVVVFYPGYKDFYLNALPIIRARGIPATLFVPTSFIDTTNVFWVDSVLQICRLLQRLGRPFPQLPFCDDNFYKLTNTRPDKIEPHDEFAFRLVNYLHIIPPAARFVNLQALYNDGAKGLPYPEFFYFMSWAELQEAYQQGVSIGTMGYNHKTFNETPAEELLADIMLGIKDLFAHNIEAHSAILCPDRQNLSSDIRTALKDAGLVNTLNTFALSNVLDAEQQSNEFAVFNINESIAALPVFLAALWESKIFNKKVI